MRKPGPNAPARPRLLLEASCCCFIVFFTHRVLVDVDLQEDSIRVLLTELDKHWANHLAGTTPVQAGMEQQQTSAAQSNQLRARAGTAAEDSIWIAELTHQVALKSTMTCRAHTAEAGVMREQ
jgi:hypothetical protein